MKCDQCGVENGQHAANCKFYGTYNFPAADHPVPRFADHKICPACQTSNPATAKFCAKCGMSFRVQAKKPRSSSSSPRATALTMTSGTALHVSGATVSTITTERVERPPVRGTDHPAAALSGEHRRRNASSLSKFRVLGVGLLVLVIAAIWWSSRIDDGISPQHLDEATSHAPVAPPAALTLPDQPVAAPSPADDSAQEQALQVTNKLAEAEAAKAEEKNTLERARIEQETRAKRAAEAKRTAETRRRSDGLTQRKRDEEGRLSLKREEAERRGQQPVAASAATSPQQACAGNSNFISRGICEARECAKPQWAALPYCVDMKERLKPRTADR